ncbi:MAG TPA: type II toxin-antitoxin system VapC family toxin [Terracidiphilus sp.]|nr:type II toxin-antitoxin system VapC family toxin [Terracidiphilus sp.]
MSTPAAYLLDTNVVSETRKKKADAGVMAFLRGIDSSSLYLSVLTIGELRKGVAAKKPQDPIAAKSLAAWVEGLEAGFADRILEIDLPVARLWGEWSGDRPRAVIDTLLAATASVHGLTLVTRNTQHVLDLTVKTLNPWSG